VSVGWLVEGIVLFTSFKLKNDQYGSAQIVISSLCVCGNLERSGQSELHCSTCCVLWAVGCRRYCTACRITELPTGSILHCDSDRRDS
jgi:hypothetical protein